MAPKRVQAIVFDLFNTLLELDLTRLPEVEFQGRRIRTTTVRVYRELEKHYRVPFSYPRYLEVFLESGKRLEELRGSTCREFSTYHRHRWIQRRLGLEEEAVEGMVRAHMGEMLGTFRFPESHRRTLDRLREWPLLLASNFDHAPTARRALRRFGLEGYFDHVLISDELGWRKPGSEFFQVLLEKVGGRPQDCIYVGDDPWADVYGASRAGFPVAWLATGRDPGTSLPASPGWILNELRELLDIVAG